LYFFN